MILYPTSELVGRDHFGRMFKSLLSKPAGRSKVRKPRIPIPSETKFKGRFIPHLPVELWILIIREATAITPDPLDMSRVVSFLDSPHCKLRDYRASMQCKQDISLVCHSWNQMTREFVYEVVWISRASQARALASTLLAQHRAQEARPSGRFIRSLHIETPTLERCAPDDLRTILDYSPGLVLYSDYRSIRRNFYDQSCDPRSSPQELFSALAHPKNNLRRLAWTNYDDVSFHFHMSPTLETTATNLQYLELSVCSPHSPSLFSEPAEDAYVLSTCTPVITLPALRTLKVTLDNATFAVLAAWAMPALTNLSVVSSDFSYAGTGFSKFFHMHGPKISQLELGHSSSTIEEHYLTHTQNPQPIPLADWCPNLREFICSADAEWNWQNPDWIAPHILLPTHPRLEFIGVRDIDKRLVDDAAVSPSRSVWDDAPFFPLLEQVGTLLHRPAFPALMYIRDLSETSDAMRRHPQARVNKFWMKVLLRCQERKVWLEDFNGVNVTVRDIKRAGLNLDMSM